MKNIYLFFLTTTMALLSLNSNAQCSGTWTSTTNSCQAFLVGNGTPGSIRICLDANNIPSGGGTSCNPGGACNPPFSGGGWGARLAIFASDGTTYTGTPQTTWYGTTTTGTCFTVSTSNGYAYIMGLCLTAGTSISWTTVNACGDQVCTGTPPPCTGAPCQTCESACSACGFETTPTVTDVTSTCQDYPFSPPLTSGQTSTRCHSFTAVNTTVSFQVIVSGTGCTTGNVTNFTWTLQDQSCGGVIQSGTLSNMTFTGLTVGQTYTYCYTFTASCTHNTHYPYFVGAASCELPDPPSGTGAQRCGTGSVTLSAAGCAGTITWYANANGSAGGAALGTGATFVTPSLTATRTYYATCSVDGCESVTTPVVATINPLPTITGATVVCVGLTSQLTGSGTPAASNPWTSSNTAVATVSSSGLVTGVSLGTSTITYTDINGCFNTIVVTVSNPVQPTFTQLGPFCLNGTPGPLPTTSLEGFTGTWTPATISTAALGSTIYTFNPTVGQCATSTTMTIDVAAPTVDAGGDVTICPGECVTLNGTSSVSPGSSNSTFTNNTTIAIPDNNAAGANSTINVSGIPVSAEIQSVCFTIEHSRHNQIQQVSVTAPDGTVFNFTPLPLDGANNSATTYCFDATIFNSYSGANSGNWVLNVQDLVNNRIGSINNFEIVFIVNNVSWSPTTNMTGFNTLNPEVCPATTTTYTLTVNASGGCSASDEVTVTVSDPVIPTFTQLGPYCQGATPGVLPSVSNNGFTGTWSPATISTGSTGSVIYTFTPTAGQCAVPTTMTVNVLPNTTGTVNYTGCEGDGFSVTVNGNLYNQSNPTGTETLLAANGCDSVVTIDLVFLPNTTGAVNYSGCEGDGHSVTVNGVLYNESNPTGTETLTNANNCDSVVTVNLVFLPNTTGTVNYTGCEGDGHSVTVNGVLYNESNPIGSETLTNANNCDSVVTIDLVFLPNLVGAENYTGCQGDGYSVTVNGNLYNQSNPTGTETLSAANGCDSVVTIDLVFLPNTTGAVNYSGCEGDGHSVTVNGVLYNESNPSGTETLTNANNCDSVVTVNLVFLPNTTGTVNYTGCEGDGHSVTVNGTLYNESNPTGTETLMAANGCDSVVTVNLIFHPETSSTVSHNGCLGDGFSVTVNGTIYDESNPTGTEILTNVNSCDSVVTINLSFLPNITGAVNYSGCEGDGYSVVVNGNLYNEANPTGTEVFVASGGCDSTVTVNLLFFPSSSSVVNYNGCEGDNYSVTVNGVVYDESNPSGTEMLTNANNCDSTVTVNLIFSPNSIGAENYMGCEGDGYSVTVNGVLYNESNPSGTETLLSANGCDSVVTINLQYFPETSSSIVHNGCEGDGFSVTVNGIVYDELNPIGTEILTNANGCDSTVTINLTFSSSLTGNVNYNGCEGDGHSVTVNGTLYNESNPNGTELFVASGGCDSLVTINLVYLPNTAGSETYTGCQGDGYSVTVNGVLYNQSNPTGSETLMNANGCDSVVTINLAYLPNTTGAVNYTGCEGDGFNVTVNGTLYNESNPSGTETLTNANNCDSVVTVTLVFNVNHLTFASATSCNPSDTGVFVNNFTNQFGCDSIHTFTVAYNESDSTFEALSSCNPADEGVVVFGLTNQFGCDSVHTITTSLLPSSATTVSVGTCDPAEVGDEDFVFSNEFGCDSVHTVTTFLHPVTDHLLTATPDTILFSESSLLSVTEGVAFEWAGLAETDSFVVVVPQQDTEFFVEVTDENGCVQELSVTVYVFLRNVNLLMPDAFTPNGDGINDIFEITNKADFREIEMRVYNRWGQLVHEGEGQDHGWDGTFNGEKQNSDLYVYYVRALPFTSDEYVSLKANFTLIR
jgi:gliding motility-associated-like protein